MEDSFLNYFSEEKKERNDRFKVDIMNKLLQS